MFAKAKNLSALLICACFLSACAGGMLQTKDFKQPYYFAIDQSAAIPKTDEHYEILRLVQRYRDAIASRDIETLRSMISREYYENASTTDDLSDDYGIERIDEILQDYLAESVRDIRFIIEVKRLTQERYEYHVDYQYIWNYRYEVAGQSYWQSKNDINRMTIIREDDTWKIRGGL